MVKILEVLLKAHQKFPDACIMQIRTSSGKIINGSLSIHTSTNRLFLLKEKNNTQLLITLSKLNGDT